MGSLLIAGLRCERCNHQWVPESFSSVEMPLPDKAGNELVLLINQLIVAKNKPKVCPKCKSPYWDTPRRPSG